MPNLARFTINATPSSSPGFDGSPSQVLTFALDGGPASLVTSWTLQVYSASEADAPRASKSAPLLTLVGSTSGQKVNAATPAATITCTLPSGVHTWIVRSKVNGGFNAKGAEDPDYVFERVVCIKTGSGIRKVVSTEGVAYSPNGWSDAQNDLVDAGAGPLTAPGGAGDANKLAAANGAGANLQYAAGIRLAASGTRLEFDAATALASAYQAPSSAATDTSRRQLMIAAQDVSGNTSTIGGTGWIRGGDATGSGGTHIGGDLILTAGWATGASGTRHGGHAKIGGGAGANSYGNVYIGTDYTIGVTNFQGMGRGVLVQNAIAAPTGDMPDGHAYWSSGGRPMWRFLGNTFRLDGTAGAAAAGGATLPANPQGFIVVQLNGATAKIPYYQN